MESDNHEQLKAYLIQAAPPSMFYIHNFITQDEEAYIVDKIPANRWISLSRRRLQAIPAPLTASNALVASSGLPEWLIKPVVERLDSFGIFRDSTHGTVNHCLINEYISGQGIMPHEDGAAYHPVVATVSLGGSIVLDVTEKPGSESKDGENLERRKWRILQESRSLLVTAGSAYKDTLHGIAETVEDFNLNDTTIANWNLLGDSQTIITNGGLNERTTRISLTYRDVLKESKVGSKIFGKART